MNCYRHPDSEAYIRCQRCERYICPNCQHESAVGFLCPECAGKTATQKITQLASNQLLVTYTIIAICVVTWLAQMLVPSDVVTYTLAYAPALTPTEPWRMITTGFLHSTSSWVPFHLGLNMYTLYIFGRVLEPMLGRARFLALYVISLFASSVAILWLNDPIGATVGASGAIFGLMGAYLVINRSLGYGSSQITSLIAINLVFSFLLPGVSWQAHVGGLLGGLAVGYIFSVTRGASARAKRVAMLSGCSVLLVAATVVGCLVKLTGYY